MGKFDHVLSPFTFGPVKVKNRIELAPMGYMLGTLDGQTTTEMVAYYENLAKGGAGIITIGEASIDYDRYSNSYKPALNLGSNAAINSLFKVNEVVAKYGAKLSIEVCHGGRSNKTRSEVIGPSAIPDRAEILAASKEGRKLKKVIAMNQEMIDQVIEDFANAFYRCKAAGLEMAMIHGAHSHLLDQFVSPHTNKRTDNYGGSLENRARFVIEVLTAIRKKVGSDFAIEYRISADEMIADGMHPEEVIEFAKVIEDKIDLLHVSAGMISTPETVPFMIQPFIIPHCTNVHYAEQFHKALKVPIVTVGSITSMEEAEEIIASNKANMVAMGRAILADPNTVNNARLGREAETRPCLRCFTCNKHTGNFLPIRCAVNPKLGRETQLMNFDKVKSKQKVVVIGGGPAGMQAALTASERGCAVALFEKDKELGGNLIPASGLELKADLKKYLAWIVGQTMKAPNVTVYMGTPATKEAILAENPDAIIIAAGSEPIIPHFEGQELNNVVWVGDVDTGKVKVGEKVLIVGAGATGAETALQLAKDGKEVTSIDMRSKDDVTSDWIMGLNYQLADYNVKFMYDIKLDKITKDGAIVMDKNWKLHKIPAETIVLSLGFRPRQTVIDEFSNLIPQVFIAGDCRNPSNIKQAIHDGFNIAAQL